MKESFIEASWIPWQQGARSLLFEQFGCIVWGRQSTIISAPQINAKPDLAQKRPEGAFHCPIVQSLAVGLYMCLHSPTTHDARRAHWTFTSHTLSKRGARDTKSSHWIDLERYLTLAFRMHKRAKWSSENRSYLDRLKSLKNLLCTWKRTF